MANKKITRRMYHIVFDNNELTNTHLMSFASLERAYAERDSYNKDKHFVEKYGKVHIELELIEREVID